LNSGAQIWKNIKERVAKKCLKDVCELRSLIIRALEELQAMPAIVRGLFTYLEYGFMNKISLLCSIVLDIELLGSSLELCQTTLDLIRGS
jgi:hypothetical protein